MKKFDQIQKDYDDRMDEIEERVEVIEEQLRNSTDEEEQKKLISQILELAQEATDLHKEHQNEILKVLDEHKKELIEKVKELFNFKR